MAPELRKRLSREDIIAIIEENQRLKKIIGITDDDDFVLKKEAKDYTDGVDEEKDDDDDEDYEDSPPKKKKQTRRKKSKPKRNKKTVKQKDTPVEEKISYASKEMKHQLRNQIIDMYQSGVKQSSIARRLKVTTSTVSRWVKRYNQTGSTKTAYRKKRAKSTQAEQADYIVDYICGIPVNEEEMDKIFVSYTTIQRRIKIRHDEFCSGKVNFIKEYKDALENFMYNKDGKKPEMLRKIMKSAYNCSVCDRPFKNNAQKLKHELCHTDLKPYPCRFCDKSFRAPHNVLVHERLHTGEKPYLCRFCEKRFIDIGNCYKHIGNRHKELLEEAKSKDIRVVIRVKDSEDAENLIQKIKSENEKKLSTVPKIELPEHVQEKPGTSFPKQERSVNQMSVVLPTPVHTIQKQPTKIDKPPVNFVDELVKELISPITTVQSVNHTVSQTVSVTNNYVPHATLSVNPTPHIQSTQQYIPFPAHMQPTAAPLPPSPQLPQSSLTSAPQQYIHPSYQQSVNVTLPHTVFAGNIVQYR